MATGISNSKLALLGGTVVTPDAAVDDGVVLIEDGVIVYAGSRTGAISLIDATVIDARDKYVLPGFVDTHVHGGHGDDVMRDGAEGIRRIARSMLRYGTTSFLPTTMSASHQALVNALEDCVAAMTDDEIAADILGVHVEGPYINVAKKGAQSASDIRNPNLEECEDYLRAAGGLIKIMTLAPEIHGGIELVEWLTKRNIIASLGHSDADYKTTLAAIDAGATHATHLFNAMPALHHRQPNLTTASLNEPAIIVEMILDGVHVAPEMARLTASLKGRENLILITDAMAAVGCADGEYTLGDSQVQVKGNRCTLPDGETIAGSILTMNRALANAVEFTNMNIVDATYAAATLPAKICGAAKRKGSLETGKDADIAMLNKDFSIAMTIKAGSIAFQQSE
jgi:N-acetylglucosamine-6-phosphate deacetylase